MICSVCQVKNPKDAPVCVNCGRSLDAAGRLGKRSDESKDSVAATVAADIKPRGLDRRFGPDYNPDDLHGTKAFIASAALVGVLVLVANAANSDTVTEVAALVIFVAGLVAVTSLGFMLFELTRIAVRRRRRADARLLTASRFYLLIASIAVVGMFIYQHHQIGKLSNANDALTSSVSDLQSRSDQNSSDISDLQSSVQTLQSDIDQLRY